MNRKEFLKTGGRILILGGMAVSTGYLIVNERVDTTCSVSPSCTKCGKLSSCELPQAKEVNNGKK
ncbi:MAG: hypothetical protein ACOC0R_02465 [Mariniphaga sp.]